MDVELSEEAESHKQLESVSRGSDADGDTAFGWRPTSGSAEDAADGDGDAADGDGAREDTSFPGSGSEAEAASGSVAEAAADSVVEAAPPPTGSGSEDSADPTSSGSEDVGASELEELSGLVSATEVSTIGLSLGASSGEGEAGGLAGELDMTEPKNYGHSECHQFLGSGRRRKHA